MMILKAPITLPGTNRSTNHRRKVMKRFRLFPIIYSVFSIIIVVIGVLMLFDLIEMNTMLAIIIMSYGVFSLVTVMLKATSKDKDKDKDI